MNLALQSARLAHAAVLAAVLAGCGEEPQAPQSQAPAIDSPAAVVAALERAYQQRDPDLLAALLANDPDNNARYLFLLSEPSSTGETQWGYLEEVRIHQRMFHPESPGPGDRPVPVEFWLQALSINLTPNEIFSDRPDLYTDATPVPGPLDKNVWRAMDASYGTDLFFDLAGDTDYTVNGTANFVVIENLTKVVGEAGKFLLLIWEDVGGLQSTRVTRAPAAVRPPLWGERQGAVSMTRVGSLES